MSTKNENKLENIQRWKENNPQKVSAYTMVNNAVRSGVLVKPNSCEFCGAVLSAKRLQAHHEDYNKPLCVIWLCARCHSNLHKEKRNHKKPIGTKTAKASKKDSFIEEVTRLRDVGLSYGEISHKIGISKSQVYKWLNNTTYK